MIDETVLAQHFVELAQLKKREAELEKLIAGYVLEIGQTRKIAGITASYYKAGFETPDYEGAARSAMPAKYDLGPFSTTKVTVSWKSVCEDLAIIPAPGSPKPASVKIKYE